MKKILLVLAVLALGLTTASAQKVRVMSYNVHNCGGVDGVKSIKRCADIILEANADVVAIQEVDSMTRRNKKYMLGELAKLSGYHAYYGKTIPYQGGGYGIGVLSKEPALSVVEADRITSVAIIKEVASKLKKPVFIAGDMNARPTSKPMKAFKEFAQVLSDENKFTISADNPRACIDYVLGTNGSFKVLKDRVFYDSYASDHLPLYVDVKIGKQKKSKR